MSTCGLRSRSQYGLRSVRSPYGPVPVTSYGQTIGDTKGDSKDQTWTHICSDVRRFFTFVFRSQTPRNAMLQTKLSDINFSSKLKNKEPTSKLAPEPALVAQSAQNYMKLFMPCFLAI